MGSRMDGSAAGALCLRLWGRSAGLQSLRLIVWLVCLSIEVTPDTSLHQDVHYWNENPNIGHRTGFKCPILHALF
jgi:hypothetical protein